MLRVGGDEGFGLLALGKELFAHEYECILDEKMVVWFVGFLLNVKEDDIIEGEGAGQLRVHFAEES